MPLRNYSEKLQSERAAGQLGVSARLYDDVKDKLRREREADCMRRTAAERRRQREADDRERRRAEEAERRAEEETKGRRSKLQSAKWYVVVAFLTFIVANAYGGARQNSRSHPVNHVAVVLEIVAACLTVGLAARLYLLSRKTSLRNRYVPAPSVSPAADFTPTAAQIAAEIRRIKKAQTEQPRVPNRDTRRRVLERDGYECKICGRHDPSGLRLSVDHVEPYSLGGLTVESNLQVLCSQSNASKGNRTAPPSGRRRKSPRLVNRDTRNRILKRDGYTCKLCGRHDPYGVLLHIDHVRASSLGGLTVDANLQVLCFRCNASKRNRATPFTKSDVDAREPRQPGSP